MINITQQPPRHITINDTEYPINWDFKVWVEISLLFQQIDPENPENENQELLLQAVYLAFDCIVNEPAQDVINAMVEFMQGYPVTDNGYTQLESESGEKLYSFKHDINYIVIAIRNQSGIDLTYRRSEPFHWWDFMLEFQTLEAEHYICKIMGYRGYTGEDKEYIKLREIHALPRELTRSEQRMVDELNEVFFNS